MSVFVDAARSGTPQTDHLVSSGPKVMVNADIAFTAMGDVQITSLWSECYTANGATASTLQWQVVPVLGTGTTISGASVSLANAIAGTICVVDGAALSSVPTTTAAGVALNTTARGIIFKNGTLKTVIGVGSTTGTWKHYLRYEPLEDGAYVVANF